jgi:hypothetical protein
MQVKTGDRIYLDVRAKAEPAESIVTTDYYTQLPQIRLTGDSTGRPIEPETSTAVTLDGNDIAKLVESAIRDPAPNGRSPPGVHSYALLPIGYPMGRFGPVRRIALSDVVCEDRWGQPYRDL